MKNQKPLILVVAALSVSGGLPAYFNTFPIFAVLFFFWALFSANIQGMDEESLASL